MPINDSNGLDQLDDVVYKLVHLRLNGTGTKFMSVNGTATNQNFSYLPTDGHIWNVESIYLFIQDSGTPDPNDFGAGGGLLGGNTSLTNGLVLEYQQNSQLFEICNLGDNMDLSLVFFSSYSQGSGSGWLNNNDTWLGEFKMLNPLKINANTNDFIRFRVRDNLTGIGFLQTMVKCWRKL